jgi:hypothetical protein
LPGAPSAYASAETRTWDIPALIHIRGYWPGRAIIARRTETMRAVWPASRTSAMTGMADLPQGPGSLHANPMVQLQMRPSGMDDINTSKNKRAKPD